MDLNILISTIITATAALVAIIGGFLVSRVITLSGERNSIERRLKEINNDLLTKQGMLDNIDTKLLEKEVENFFDKYGEEIILSKKEIGTILEEDEISTLTEQELKPYVQELNSIREHLLELFEQANNGLPEDFDEFVKDNDIKIDKRKNWYRLVYDALLTLIPEEKPQSTFPWGLNMNLSKLAPIKIVSPITQQIHRDQIKERNNLQDDLTVLKIRKAEQEKIIQDYGKPSGLWGGFWVLVYACIVGILYPSTLLPYPSKTYNDELTKWFLLFLFFSQLVVLFIYLGISMKKLSKTTGGN